MPRRKRPRNVGREVRGVRPRPVKCHPREVAWELRTVEVGED